MNLPMSLPHRASRRWADVLPCTVAHAGRSAVCVTPAGELDLGAVPALAAVMDDALADADLVILDLRQLEFIDSSGARLLMVCDALARHAAKRLVVVRGRDEVDRYLRLTRIDQLLEVVDEPTGLVPVAPR